MRLIYLQSPLRAESTSFSFMTKVRISTATKIGVRSVANPEQISLLQAMGGIITSPAPYRSHTTALLV